MQNINEWILVYGHALLLQSILIDYNSDAFNILICSGRNV